MRLRFASALAVTAAACTSHPGAQAALRRTLESHYAQTRVNVSFMRNSSHLNLLLDGSPFRQTPDSELTSKALDLARFALAAYSSAAQLESLTVRFVRFVPRAGESYCFARSTTFRVRSQASSPDSALSFAGQNINHGPCYLDPTLTP
jgi:hypothetical protein